MDLFLLVVFHLLDWLSYFLLSLHVSIFYCMPDIIYKSRDRST